jgi:hypothetical protein
MPEGNAGEGAPIRFPSALWWGALEQNDGVSLYPGVYDDTVLVGVMNHPADLARARDEGWYRIPLDQAPRRVAADWLAFYQTAAFGAEECFRIRWLAPVLGYRLATRRELIPSEPDHPRAEARYFRIELGPLAALARPVPSLRLRRITFIATTLERLLHAEEVNDLWVKTTAQDRLWHAFRAAGLDAEREYPLREDQPEVTVDFAFFCRDGKVALVCTEADGPSGRAAEGGLMDYLAASQRWVLLRVPSTEILDDPSPALAQVRGEIRRLGGLE